MKKLQVFRSLRYRNYRLYFTGQSISLIGTWMQRMAVSWLVYRLTHSALMLGIVSFAGLIPSLLLSPYAGALTDRHNRYRILLYSQIASMIQSGLLALMVLMHYYNITGIILLSIAQGVINAFDTTSRQSLMIEFIEDKADLPNAIALNSTMVNLARILGPALAGIILNAFGEGVCFLVDFLTFVAVIISLLMMRLVLQPSRKNNENIWEGFKQGYRYLQTHRDIRATIIMMAFTSIFVTSFSTLMPVFARDIYKGNATTFSWFGSSTGIGALCSAIYMASLKQSKRLLNILSTASVLFGLGVLLFSLVHILPLALLFLMLGGAGMMMQISSTNTYIQTHVDNHMRGRIISYYVMAFQGMLPIGSLITGFAAHRLGAPLTVSIEGCLGLVCAGVFTWYMRRLRAQQALSADNVSVGGSVA
ncbi:MFS transporter [Deminuibacter soli]|uniref:MFS transporter n=1 Tax=Deminuibacter soli TaxID=2291815 RepID=A0A3E1NCB9_9BACT|nr:MFS transporter [Deminuibacter soli]RFM25626.1 MFS transporter [Deminuibacter soli]